MLAIGAIIGFSKGAED